MTLKRALLAVLGIVGPVMIAVVSLTAIDLYFHHRYLDHSGYNAWGYRGPVIGRKRPGETRFVLLGGSTAFGYGVKWQEAISAQLERRLNARLPAGTSATVVNLGFMGEGAYSFPYTLQDYEFLDYDVAILYEGYNDANPTANRDVFRRQSPVFRLTGYMPILPIILREKVMAIRYGGDLNAAYRGEKVVFSPTLAQRTTASAIKAASDVSDALSRQLERFAQEADARPESGREGPCGRWADYCDSIAAATDYMLARGKATVFVGQPTVSQLHISQKTAVRDMLRTRYHDERVVYFDVDKAVDMSDTNIVFDGIHLVPEGNRQVAEAVLPQALKLVKVIPAASSSLPQTPGVPSAGRTR